MPEQFTIEEESLLEKVIEEYLSDLRMEISDTDDYDFRQRLKRKAEVLQEILLKIETIRIAPIL